jgi:predicted TIM-barrel fold metal-dependent hydrolase
MPEYRPYLPAKYRDDFDLFCRLYAKYGFRNFDAESLRNRLDSDVLDQWVRDMHDSGKVDGNSDPARRLEIMEAEGISAEVLFPDFGLPFELFPPLRQVVKTDLPRGAGKFHPRTSVHLDQGFRAHNRWLVDFCSIAPFRFAPMACVLFDDVDAAVREIGWAREAGFKGVLLPIFDEQTPLFHERFERIWSTLEDLEMPVNTHVVNSGAVPLRPFLGAPHASSMVAVNMGQFMSSCHEILTHMIWGGVLERHPGLRVCFTEQGSSWVIGKLREWDFRFDGSYFRRDIREVLKRPPSEYFRGQCFLGSSLFSREEVEARHEIGLEQMLLGMDYPHHEGTFGAGGTREYLRATLGAVHVPPDEARQMLGQNHIGRWGLDGSRLAELAGRIGPPLDEILTPPTENHFPRGDVNKPLAANNIG